MPEESQRVAELLDHVQKGDKRRFDDFCIALENSSQKEIADKLRNQIGRDVEDAVPNDSDDVPLSRENGHKLTAIWNELIDKMMTSDGKLLGELISLKVFSDLQLRKLKASY